MGGRTRKGVGSFPVQPKGGEKKRGQGKKKIQDGEGVRYFKLPKKFMTKPLSNMKKKKKRGARLCKERAKKEDVRPGRRHHDLRINVFKRWEGLQNPKAKAGWKVPRRI